MLHLSWKGGARPFALNQNIKHRLLPKQNHLKAYQNNLHVPVPAWRKKCLHNSKT